MREFYEILNINSMKIYVWLARLILAVLVFMLVALVVRCVPSAKSLENKKERQLKRDSRRLELAKKRSPELFGEDSTLTEDSGTAIGRELDLDSLLSELCPDVEPATIITPYDTTAKAPVITPKFSDRKEKVKKAIKEACTLCALIPAQTIRTENDATVTVKPAANCKDLDFKIQNWRIKETIFIKHTDLECFRQILPYAGGAAFIILVLGILIGRATKK